MRRERWAGVLALNLPVNLQVKSVSLGEPGPTHTGADAGAAEATTHEKVLEDAAWTPDETVGPAADVGLALVEDEDVARGDEAAALVLV